MSPIIFEPRPLSQVTWHCTLYRRRWSTFEKILGKRIFDPFKGYFKLLPPHFIPSLFLKYSLEYFCPVFERDENRGRRPRKENHFSFFLQICIWGKKYFWAVWRFGAAVSKVSGFFPKGGMDCWLGRDAKNVIRHVSVTDGGHGDHGPPEPVGDRLEVRLRRSRLRKINSAWK